MSRVSIYKAPVHYVAQIDIPNVVQPSQPASSANSSSVPLNIQKLPELILILDRSGSMGNNFSILLREVLPKVLFNLGYALDYKFSVITFDSVSNIYEMNIRDMEQTKMRSQGSTNMKGAISCLSTILNRNEHSQYRILTISDGLNFFLIIIIYTIIKLIHLS